MDIYFILLQLFEIRT